MTQNIEFSSRKNIGGKILDSFSKNGCSNWTALRKKAKWSWYLIFQLQSALSIWNASKNVEFSTSNFLTPNWINESRCWIHRAVGHLIGTRHRNKNPKLEFELPGFVSLWGVSLSHFLYSQKSLGLFWVSQKNLHKSNFELVVPEFLSVSFLFQFISNFR